MTKPLILAVLVLASLVGTGAAAEPSGAAIAIIYDTSGSMSEPVANAKNAMEPKYRVASAALESIAGKIDAFAKTHPVEAALITFQGTQVPLGKWDRAPFAGWLAQFDNPTGNTPLGEAITTAGKALASSALPKKHIVVITDGDSNGPLRPEAALRGLKKQANPPQVYVVAFDVKSQAFDALKKEGAVVLPASGKTLDSGLRTLFSEKILLEDEE
jgi:Mg-chelatase subunit ChlD